MVMLNHSSKMIGSWHWSETFLPPMNIKFIEKKINHNMHTGSMKQVEKKKRTKKIIA